MGYCKVVAKVAGKVVFVHQLDQDGKTYAENVTIEAQKDVSPNRVDWSSQDGQVGTLSWMFTPFTTPVEGYVSTIKFPEAE